MLNIQRTSSVAITGTLLLGITACGGGGAGTEAGGEAGAQGSCGDGQNTIKIANYFAEDHSQNVALRERFKPLVEENTDLTVEIYPNNELGAEEQFTNAVRGGTVEMAVAGMGLQTSAPKLGVAEWPFLFEDYDHAQNALNGELGDSLAEEFETLGVQHLGWTANGFRNFSSNQPIASMEDFEGFRVRLPDLPLYISMGEALGASVYPMPISEVFTALEQGVVDGQDNPYATLRASGWYEVQSHVLESRHMFSPNAYLMNADFWQCLPEEDQAAIESAAEESSNYQWELSRESVEEDKQFLQEEGLEIITPDASFRENMVQAMEPVYEELNAQYDWTQEYRDMAQAAATTE